METPNHPLEKYKDLLPSKGELVCRSLFAPTEQEREAAKRLAAIVPEAREEEHPLLTLKRLFPEGSEALRLAEETPIGRSIEELCAMQPDEIFTSEELVDEFMDVLDQAEPAEPPKPVEPTVAPPDPPPAPPAPSAWQSLNFKDPIRQSQGEASKIRRWEAGKPTKGTGSWDSAREPLDW